MKVKEVPWRSKKDLKTLVENRVVFEFENCELNIFETYEEAEDVFLSFDHFVLTAMLKGKKNMALGSKPFFDYLPGEIVIAPPDEVMRINFPESTPENPTQCIAISISEESIKETFNFLNDKHPRLISGFDWGLDSSFYHLLSRKDLNQIVGRFMSLAISDSTREKHAVASLTLKEMLIRLSQTQARAILEASFRSSSNSNPMAHVINYIKNHLSEKLRLKDLSKMAYMSPSHFSRKFKMETGISLTEFIQLERLKLAKTLLVTTNMSVRDIGFRSGFTDVNFFNRVFKREIGRTPSEFRTKPLKNLRP